MAGAFAKDEVSSNMNIDKSMNNTSLHHKKKQRFSTVVIYHIIVAS